MFISDIGLPDESEGGSRKQLNTLEPHKTKTSGFIFQFSSRSFALLDAGIFELSVQETVQVAKQNPNIFR